MVPYADSMMLQLVGGKQGIWGVVPASASPWGAAPYSRLGMSSNTWTMQKPPYQPQERWELLIISLPLTETDLHPNSIYQHHLISYNL